MTEEQLIEGCRNEDNHARKCLYEQYAKKMFALCYRYVNDSDIAQDVLQDGFLKIYEKISSYTLQGSFEGWLKRIFVNTALDYLRKQKYNVSFEDAMMNDVAEEENYSIEDSGLSGEILLSMLQKIPKGYSTVFNMIVVEQYSQREVAQMLKITEGGVRSQYARARKLLMKMVSEYQIRNK